MKAGRSLTELATEIERQQDAMADYKVQSSALTLSSWAGTGQEGTEHQAPGSALSIGGMARAEVSDLTHSQLATHLDIPARYYTKLRAEQPWLLDNNVNVLLKARPASEVRMVRTMDGRARAFLSDKYRRLDNYGLLEVILPELMEVPGLSIESCEVTEQKLYLKATTDRVKGEVLGQQVQAGILITNSEVGLGAFNAQPLSYVLSCLNGMVHNSLGHRRNHVGPAHNLWGEEVARVLADDTIRAQDKAFYLMVRDVVRMALSEALFTKVLEQAQEAQAQPLLGDPVKAVEVLAKKVGLNEKERGGVLRHLINGGNLSKWGVANAITREAQDVESYDRSTELEVLGGNVITLARDEWRVIATAA